MHNHSNKPAKPQPRLIPLYLRDAQPTESDVRDDGKAAVDARRVPAVRALHALWSQWKTEVIKETREVEAARERIAGPPLPRFEEPTVEAAQRVTDRWMALGAPGGFNFLLRNFFERAGRIIFASSDPPAAMRVFWEAPRRGRSAEANAERNRNLTEAVQDRVDAGESIERAIGTVADREGMRRDTLHKIYYNKCLEVRAVRELRTLWDAEQ